jgi:hypothetical protein
MVGGMGTSAIGAMSARTDTIKVMATGVVVEPIGAMIVTVGAPA